ncbi:MAG TPA: redoxin domain-containing protein [Pirellulales bacterium]
MKLVVPSRAWRWTCRISAASVIAWNLFAAVGVRSTFAQDSSEKQESPEDEDEAPATIEFPTTWINSDPISAASLRGKAVLLYFFEENCPNCRARWPSIMEKAHKYDNEPILFVAVNSGSPKQDVEVYARAVNLTWPIIVDLDRSLEQKADLGEISLQNVMQVAYVTAEGDLRPGSWSDLDDTIERALTGAKWNVDPVNMPDDLMPAWRHLEFCQFAEARPTIAKALTSRKPETKAAAQKLSDFVTKRSERDLKAAEKSLTAGNKLRAYERYVAVADRFAGYTAGDKAAAARRDLAKDPALRKEIAAMKQFDKQRELANSPKPVVREKARAAIQKIIDDQPTSEAARRGRELLHKK